VSQETLVCFAVKEEAAPFRKSVEKWPRVGILVTGMGQRNAERAIREALAVVKPELVLTCGFAGGLNPELRPNQIVFSAPDGTIEARLLSAGGAPARFHCSPGVAATAKAKQLLRKTTGADAVEMESGIIQQICARENVPCAIVRVILDAAGQDLPLDFNQVMTRKQDISFFKLALALVKAPQKIPALIRFQRQAQSAAETLADFLGRVL
jgi:adenosylhomocysteine nucleosidase